MEASVFILSPAHDPHASALAWALQRNGVPCRFNSSLRVNEATRLSIHLGETKDLVTIDAVDGGNIRSVWHRRPRFPKAGPCHEADRAFIEGQWKCLQRNVFDLAEHLIPSLWVNRPRAAEYAESKIAQLQAARASGLLIPDTVVGNHAPDIAALIQRWGKIVFKTFYPQNWQSASEGMTYSMSVAPLDGSSDLPEQAIGISPGIYQRYIDKVFDVRITVIGGHIFAVKMYKASGEAYFDWREHSGDKDMRYELFSVGDLLEAKLRETMSRLGIVFGCFDLVVDRHGEIYFLEVNQAGQFLFVEEAMPELKMLRAMTAMLSAGSTDYDVNDCVDLRLSDYLVSDDYREIGSAVRDVGQQIAIES